MSDVEAYSTQRQPSKEGCALVVRVTSPQFKAFKELLVGTRRQCQQHVAIRHLAETAETTPSILTMLLCFAGVWGVVINETLRMLSSLSVYYTLPCYILFLYHATLRVLSRIFRGAGPILRSHRLYFI